MSKSTVVMISPMLHAIKNAPKQKKIMTLVTLPRFISFSKPKKKVKLGSSYYCFSLILVSIL